MRKERGTITSWKDDKGFGFITPKTGGKQIFVHIKEFSKKHQRPVAGLKVEYVVSQDPQRRPCAVHVAPTSGNKRSQISIARAIPAIAFTSMFFAFLAGCVMWDKLQLEVLYTYTALSVFTYAMYAGDKSAAKAGRWRTSEKALHIFSLVGGWPGAMVAQSMLRHKSKKLSFRFVYYLTVIINCYFLYNNFKI